MELRRKSKAVIFCGSRRWTNSQLVQDIMQRDFTGFVIIEGGASGADTHAGRAASVLGMRHRVVHAEWDKYGNAAGSIRNRKMLEIGMNEFELIQIVAFSNNLAESRGTANMLKQAEERGVPYVIYNEHGVLTGNGGWR